MDYITVDGVSTGSFTEKKSEFIGSLSHVTTEEEAVSFIERIRSENRKARHNVYAYILRDGNISRYSDDSEPQGTAGIPSLEVLKKEGLTDVCLVTTRYFGGILLGTGGLARAYTQAAKLACEAARIMKMCECRTMDFFCDYSLYGMLGALLAQPFVKQLSCDFEDVVRITVNCRIAETENFIKDITEISNGRIQVNCGEPIYADFS